MFVLTTFIFAAVSGWRQLAQNYPAGGAVPSPLKYFVWGQVGRIYYRKCLNVGGDERGLYLVPFFVFRPFHPPLFIPWSEIQARTQERFLFMRVDTLDLGRGFSKIRIQSSALEPFQANLPSV